MEDINYHNMSDEELSDLCKKCDDTALHVLIGRMESVVANCVKSFSDSRFESEDLMQEGLVACFRAILSYDKSKGASLKTFAAVCINNALKNFVKKKNNVLLSGDSDFVSFEEDAISGLTAEDEYISAENYNSLRQSLKKVLSETEYKVFGFFVDGLSYSEISEKTGQSVKGVDNTLQRVRKKLKSIL